ncbi:hypothetical protein CEW87_02435 [Parazoarcus communis]|uniref:Uncharacterized protein n=1 Tax=Parazoarcus communis TaxID=41977 RepID=A0A2U8GXV4_9RHOO|nr:hypothetical protein [Parazoarcus communis]AWI78308.1 hypothetical protein CEW87_02435 [Parazoarcus communis]
MNQHTELLEHVVAHFGDRLHGAPQLTQDALALSLDNGVQLTIRYASTDAYSLRWRFQAGGNEIEMGIDTAPTHPTLATHPNHLHLSGGRAVADPLTRTDASPADNLSAVIEALLRDPQLDFPLP